MWERRIAYHVDADADDTSAIAYLLNRLGIVARPFPMNGLADRLHDVEPGCLLLDGDLVGLDHAAVYAAAASRRIELPLVVMSAEVSVAAAVAAMRNGACDVLAKPLELPAIADTMARVFDRLRDERLAHDQRQEALTRVETLTEREQEVFRGLVEGCANKALAHQLGVSIRTIEMHRANLMIKLGVHSLAAAVRLAFVAGRPRDLAAGDSAEPRAGPAA